MRYLRKIRSITVMIGGSDRQFVYYLISMSTYLENNFEKLCKLLRPFKFEIKYGSMRYQSLFKNYIIYKISRY